jgi:hypothetical protein
MAVALMAASIITLNPSPAHAEALPYRCEYFASKAVQIGWPKKEKAKLKKIMWRESRCQHSSNFQDPHGGSFGLLQVNMSNFGWAKRNGWVDSKDDLLKTHQNLKVGLELFKLYGWRPWGTRSSHP